jgi:hypothetical protein
MTRAPLTYADGAAGRTFEGFDPSVPVAGYYRLRLNGRGVWGVVRIWLGPPHDPVTGEELDRGWRWQASFNGEPIDLERAWPVCAKHPTDEQHYRRVIARQQWAQEHAPGTAYADPRARHDPLSGPLPF